jgi:hypothetical protein
MIVFQFGFKPRRQGDTEKHRESLCLTVPLCLRGSKINFEIKHSNQ